MDNKNFDLMVRIDYDSLNEYMMSLHKRTTASAEFKTTKYAPLQTTNETPAPE